MTEASEILQRPQLTLLLGGVRSGKSAKAVALAKQHQREGRTLFVATAEVFDHDAEMRARIAAHRQERPPTWDTLESPLALASDLSRTLAEHRPGHSVIVIDCLTLWVSNILLSLPGDADAEAIVADHAADLLSVRNRSRALAHWIVVSNEVGLGIVPATSLGRRYRDALGRANQLVAAAANEVILMVAGLEMSLKSQSQSARSDARGLVT
ncbi:MAG TPA: bifunctional adenosylcobinamide kinase/adenosylcobinamide-phosphate guanylyltransferase [Gemmatimonadaceae bacterium]|nr:bifunctional adenosylcobinamide kinase/adenosylcobinamide-phosphate guanylyltransferase [Gemmatimonadaceae bacterium]